MKLTTIKTDAELRGAIQNQPEGRPFAELIFRDKTVIGARIGQARFSIDSYNVLSVTRETNEEEVDKHRVRVDHPAFPTINRYFNDSSEARKFAATYHDIDGAKVADDLVTVRVDTEGKIIAELKPDGEAMPLMPQDNGDDIPF